jgi:hypothetical protein
MNHRVARVALHGFFIVSGTAKQFALGWVTVATVLIYRATANDILYSYILTTEPFTLESFPEQIPAIANQFHAIAVLVGTRAHRPCEHFLIANAINPFDLADARCSI